MSHYISGMADSRANILPCKAWICLEEIVSGRPVGEFLEDQLDRYARSKNYRFPQHYFWIRLNSILDDHCGLDNIGWLIDGERCNVIEVRVACRQTANPIFIHGCEN